MGTYLNPGNRGFQEILQSEYVDKTGLIALVNKTVGTMEKLSCISRPRRFGKSYAAKMLCAYYDCSCDSHKLFDDKEIARTEGYLAHLNQYHVISIDVAGFVSMVKKQHEAIGNVPELIERRIYEELVSLYPELGKSGKESSLADCLIRCVEKTGRQFIFIIDEWDAPIREAKEDANAQTAYLNLLREWFKNNNFTPQVVAAAYMTGILPIKKDGSQSAISDFIEYPILDPDGFAEFTGFTEVEVKRLCEEHRMSFEDARQWYDGYDFPEAGAIYNPYSVMSAMRKGKFRSYWQKTSAAESLMTYINMDFEGLQEIIARLIAGEEVEVRTSSFENDFETFKSKDDVLTLLLHLGYLTYHEEAGTARIPNEEVRIEFEKILEGTGVSKKWVELIGHSQKLLEDMIAGKGIADVVYLPKRRSVLPALIIELKWNKSSEGAIGQIKTRNYPAVLEDFGGEIVMVGINYDEKTKEHSCGIEKV